KEIVDFSQDDLLQSDVFILDAFQEVFVWVGHGAKDKTDKAFQAALDYVKKVDDGRPADVPVYKVTAGSEPPNFCCHFLGWNDDKAGDFSDPYAKAAQKLVKVTSADIGANAAVGKKYPLATLKGFKPDNNPDRIDLTAKQNYLNDAE